MERSGSETVMEGRETSMKENLSMEIDLPLKENLTTAEDWKKALDKVVPAVVVLRTIACCAFDTESAGASYATGFIVDRSRGVILTNRHVFKAGSKIWPVVAEAMFVNREEVPVYEAPSIKGNVFVFAALTPSRSS
ncbi:protease Do-like 7 [Phtheirospermum japonicum]|uniref:Protease Do-like 7 n=1 Tax=Phtheirospermum japonicum TaxID=374723 RepID=A0A830D3D0_9LAMI|nr:protease Do-like 7 [Phtheirospermum japonicum]